MQKHVKKIVDKIACETKTSRNESICIFCLKVSFESCFSWHLFQQFQGCPPPSTGLAEARHKQRSRQKTLLPKVNRLNRWSLVTSHGQLYKGYHSLISRRRFFLRRRKKSRGRARGEKERLKKVNRRLLRRLRLPQKKKNNNNKSNKQTDNNNKRGKITVP